MTTRLRDIAGRSIAVLREALASARSQPVAGLLTIATVAAMCAAALLTTGRTVATEQAALAQIDAAGTRSIVVEANSSAGLTVAVLDRLQLLGGIEEVTAFGPITDARNAAVPGAPKVAVRKAYGSIGGRPLLATDVALPAASVDTPALASSTATKVLGLRGGTGELLTDDGAGVVVVGSLDVPEQLAFLDPFVLIPSSTVDDVAGADSDESVALLVILADTPQNVAGVEAAVRELLVPADPTGVTISTSAGLAAIRAAVSGELGPYGRATVLVILAVAALLVAANLMGLVTMRRRDFGRRRALGASQPLIIVLLLSQVLMLAAIGAAAGVSIALAVLTADRQPLPGATFTLAIGVLSILTATIAAVPPAVVASRRDPLHELRVP